MKHIPSGSAVRKFRPTTKWDARLADERATVCVSGALLNEIDKIVAARGMHSREECAEWLIKSGIRQWLEG